MVKQNKIVKTRLKLKTTGKQPNQRATFPHLQILKSLCPVCEYETLLHTCTCYLNRIWLTEEVSVTTLFLREQAYRTVDHITRHLSLSIYCPPRPQSNREPLQRHTILCHITTKLNYFTVPPNNKNRHNSLGTVKSSKCKPQTMHALCSFSVDSACPHHR
jgi:hypothetical protein